jgi:succinate dehydrogenase/fumarate reductase flavoprotein subunit
MRLDCDLLVLGAGMAGLSAAGWAAERGAAVIVVEKAGAIGGSAILSGGMVWTASSPDMMRRQTFGGKPELAEVITDLYPAAMDWLRGRELVVSQAVRTLHGQGYQIDIVQHLQGCARLVTQHGGHVALDTVTEALLTDDDGRVIGARTHHADGSIDIHAKAVVLATGGYQGDPELRARHIHENARDHLLLRSNPNSTGDGLRLGQGAGAEALGTNPGFYGHLVSESPLWGEPRLFTMLSQYYSDHTLLFNEQGRRFCDESRGDHVNTNATIRQSHGRALCFWDSRVQAEHATQPIVEIATPMDKFAVALEFGGKGVVSPDLAEISAFASAQGFDGGQVVATIRAYNDETQCAWERTVPPRAEHRRVLDQSPFYALVVHPAITTTYGGVTVDPQARVLDPQGRPIPGLLAAGADAGGAFGLGYAGGLAMAMTFGVRAAQTAGWA